MLVEKARFFFIWPFVLLKRKMKMKKQRYLLKQRQEKKVKLMCARWNEFPLCVAGAYFETNVNVPYNKNGVSGKRPLH